MPTDTEEQEILAEWAKCPQAHLHNWPRTRSGRRLKYPSKHYWQEKCPGCDRYLIFTPRQVRDA
jgi:hypothetical protein